MKKTIFSLMVAGLLLFILPAQLTADEKTSTTETEEATDEMVMEVKNLVDRIGEIKAMDFSELSKSEKKELRKELRTINKELKAYSNADAKAKANAEATAQGSQTGIYISGSAIIVILLLLLLL